LVGFLFRVVAAARQISSRKRIVVVERHAVLMSQTRKKLRLDRTVQRVIDSLVHSWFGSSHGGRTTHRSAPSPTPWELLILNPCKEPLFMQLIHLA
jgi:hypothetical protein